MERNEELETQVMGAVEEVQLANRQVELLDRRRATKVKDLEEKIEEQRLVMEQQQETLDESVKTILKLYSLNNTRDDDLSVMSEDKLIARTIVPRLGTNRVGLPPIHDEDHGGIFPLASGHTSQRPTAKTHSMASAGINSSRGRELMEEVENMMQRKPRARSTGRTINHLESCSTTESQLTAETHFGPRRSWTKRTGRTHHRLRTYNEIDSVTVDDERALNEAVSLEELVSKKGGSGGIVQDLLCRRRINSIPPECAVSLSAFAVPLIWIWERG